MVNPAMITETDSVTLKCQTPSSVPQCQYFTLSGGTVRTLSCLQTLTGSELLKMDHKSSPAEVKVKCFYTVQSGDRNARSPESEYSSVSVQSETNSNKESLSTLKTSVSIVTPPADQEKIMWVIAAAVTGGVLLLGLALLFAQSRIDKCDSKRTKANIAGKSKDDQKYMVSLTNDCKCQTCFNCNIFQHTVIPTTTKTSSRFSPCTRLINNYITGHILYSFSKS
nr:uncharacterized protein LOC114917291 isoform X2 [Labrus bergylta]